MTEKGFNAVSLKIPDMHCASCVHRIEEELGQVPEVVDAAVNLASSNATVAILESREISPVLEAIRRAGYETQPADKRRASAENREAAERRLTRRRFMEAVKFLENHPLMGRPAEHDLQELVISRGNTGYVALYSFEEQHDTVLILAERHQREAGYTLE